MKIICTSWGLVVGFAATLFIGIATIHWLLLVSLAFLIAFFAYSHKYLRCPSCGQRENLLRFTRAINNHVFCQSCGKTLQFRKEKNNEDT
jgi:ribosomal protein S27E